MTFERAGKVRCGHCHREVDAVRAGGERLTSRHLTMTSRGFCAGSCAIIAYAFAKAVLR